ncbi:hypothetical protein R5R35_013722 [Gryllus longicercus]|uniref:Uncharacterized protein n=1 Tax=Gryllus longicercus TaxID=2509291 RepID=A0AAN9VUA5_9ORTH
MGEIDLNKLRSFSPDNLSDDDINYLFKIFNEYDARYDIRASDLKLLFNLALEVLKFKGEEATFYEIENRKLSAALTTKDFQHENNLTHGDDPNLEDLRQQLLHCEVQVDQLTSQLKSSEKELVIERRETEKLMSKIAILERENLELKREITSVREEASEHSALSEAAHESEVTLEKHQELITSLGQKNKHITQLLSDIEVVEKENLILREKLATVQSELSVATNHLIELSGELTSVKCSCQEKEEKLVNLEQQNLGLKNQVQEMVAQKMLRDSQLDEFTESIDNRIKEWKGILEKKDAEIEELQIRLTEISSKTANSYNVVEPNQIIVLSETLRKREDQIETLQKQLTQATKEINDSAALIEKLKQSKPKGSKDEVDLSSLTKLKAQLQLAEDKIQLLDGRLKDAEEDAKVKAEEACEALVQLREYEAGEYGLAEAVAELKAARAQCRVREADALTATRAASRLHARAARLRTRLTHLRKKLNLPPEEEGEDEEGGSEGGEAPSDSEGKEHAALVQREARLEDENVQLKLENRKLHQHIKEINQKVTDMSVKSTEQNNQVIPLNENILRKDASVEAREGSCELVPAAPPVEEGDGAAGELAAAFIGENEALRKGMHEILDSIRNQDGCSDVQVQSESLERLLEALDARHVSGWYHPAMRLQAQLAALHGSNGALRDQLRTARLGERAARDECEQLKAKIEQLESNNTQDPTDMKNAIYNAMPVPVDADASSAVIIEKLNYHLLEVLNENAQAEEQSARQEQRWQQLSAKYAALRHEVGLLLLERAAAAAEWRRDLRLLGGAAVRALALLAPAHAP